MSDLLAHALSAPSLATGKIRSDGMLRAAHDEDEVTLAVEALSATEMTADSRVVWIVAARRELPPAGPVECALDLRNPLRVVGVHPDAGSVALASLLGEATRADLVVFTDRGSDEHSAVALAFDAELLRACELRQVPGVAPIDATGDGAAERLQRLPLILELLSGREDVAVHASAAHAALRKARLTPAKSPVREYRCADGAAGVLDLRAALGDQEKAVTVCVDAHGASLVAVAEARWPALDAPPSAPSEGVYNPEIPHLERVVPSFLRAFPDKLALAAGVCESCSELVFPPRKRCPACGGEVTGRRRLSRQGVLHTLTEVRVPIPGRGANYAIGMVEFPEGPRALCSLAGGEAHRGVLDSPVSLVLRRFQTADGIVDWAWAYRPTEEG